MKTITQKYWIRSGIAGLALAASVGASQAQNITLDTFDNSTQAAEIAAWVFDYSNFLPNPSTSFSSADAASSASSGSITFTWTETSTANGGFQFHTAAGAGADLTRATYVEFDLMVDPASGVDGNGNICAWQGGFNGTKFINFNYGPWGTTFTPGVWQHFKIAVPAGTFSGPATTFFLNPWNGWGAITASTTFIVHMDNLQVDIPVPGVPHYPDVMALTFDNTTNVVTVGTTGWYGDTINTYEWTTNDAAGSPTSGSLHIVADFTPGNNSCVVAIPFDPLYPGFSNPTWDTNIVINAQHMAAVEMDVLWDTNNSTVSITNFNSVGDINGFPLGLLYNAPGGGSGGQSPAFGPSTTALPDAASNGWVHLSFPLNQATANIDQCIGLWLKKFQPANSGFSGTVAFYIDNVKFIGGAIPQSGPPLTLGKPVYGLQQVHSTGGYKREGLVTSGSGYSFVNQPNTAYTMNIASMPTDAGMSANFMFVPLQIPTVDGTGAEPNWTYPNILCAIIQRSGTGSSLTLAAKINQPTDNGSLYDASAHPTFNTPSKTEGNWSVKFTANNNILVTAPDGSSTNLAFPGVAVVNPTGLTSPDVVANFDFGAGMVVYFNSQNGGSATASGVVLGSASISRGATTLLSDNFATDTNLDIPATWLLASDGGAAVGTYLIPQSIKWFLEWPVTFSGFNVQTNSDLRLSGGWNTNAITSSVLGGVYHASVDTTNLPPSGNVFFRLKK
jgi:hypothetical protein